MKVRNEHHWVGVCGITALSALACDPKEELGARIFDDENLSVTATQACSVCHGADVGWTGPAQEINEHGAVYEGAVQGRFGNRKPPSSAYATLVPRFDHTPEAGYFGGNFWDGRATGWKLGNPAADQAQGPFLNPVEQALPSATELVSRVCGAEYGDLFRRTWGRRACMDVDKGFEAIALSIEAFESSTAVNQFSSKYDAVQAGKAKFSARERRGQQLFEGRGQCVACHVLDEADGRVLFTDFTFENLGVPANPENPFYEMDRVYVDGRPINPLGRDWVDLGLGGFLEQLAAESSWRDLPYTAPALRAMSSEELASAAQQNLGKQRVPTLRNVDKRPSPDFVKAYTHNGYFKSLKAIVHFYNTRDVLERCPGPATSEEALALNCWPAPEVPGTVNTTELGNLGLTDAEEDAIVAFLGTLSDGYWRPD